MRPSFAQACATYVHRYTLEHVPFWASLPCAGNGLYYAPQYRTDREWYDRTVFPGERDIPAKEKWCRSTHQTWPLGQWLDAPFKRQADALV